MRLDDFKDQDFVNFENWIQRKPWILKSLNKKRVIDYLKFLPDIIDLDLSSQLDLIDLCKNQCKVILSAHFEGNLKEVQALYQKMKTYSCDFIKIVVSPPNLIECLKILKFFREIKEENCIRFCLQERYRFTRFFGLVDQHPFIYCGCEGQLTGPGQISLTEIENFQSFKTRPKLLGLIGNPVDKSVSDTVYNRYFKKKKISAIYLKIKIEEKEFEEALVLLKEIGFFGLSVTTPYKIMINPCSKESYNTIFFEQNIRYENTDQMALLFFIEEDLRKKSLEILVIGFGALGENFAKKLSLLGAKVFVKNRTKEKIDRAINEGFSIKHHQDDLKVYDVVIQTSSEAFFKEDLFYQGPLGKKMIECISNPIFTSFVKKGIHENCEVFLGCEFFIRQGFFQMKEFLKEYFLEDFWILNYMECVNSLLRKC